MRQEGSSNQATPTEEQESIEHKELVELLTKAWVGLEDFFWPGRVDGAEDSTEGTHTLNVQETRAKADDKQYLKKQIACYGNNSSYDSENNEDHKADPVGTGNEEVEVARSNGCPPFVELIRDKTFQKRLVLPTECAQADLEEQCRRIPGYLDEEETFCPRIEIDEVPECCPEDESQNEKVCDHCKQKRYLVALHEDICSELTLIFVRMGKRLGTISGGSKDHKREEILSKITTDEDKQQIYWPIKKNWDEQEKALSLQWSEIFSPSSINFHKDFRWFHLHGNEELFEQSERLLSSNLKKNSRPWIDFFIATAIEMFETHNKTDMERENWRRNLLGDIMKTSSQKERDAHWPPSRLSRPQKSSLGKILAWIRGHP